MKVRCGVRVRRSLGLGVRVGVLELSSVSRLLTVPIIGSLSRLRVGDRRLKSKKKGRERHGEVQ